MDTQRIIALVVFLFSGMMLLEAWNKFQQPARPAAGTAAPISASVNTVPTPTEVGAVPGKVPAGAAPSTAPTEGVPGTGRRVVVKTDVLTVVLDTVGGDIREVVLNRHLARGDTTRAFRLMQDKVGSYYIAQSGLLGAGLPNHTSIWEADKGEYSLEAGDSVEVRLTNRDAPGVVATKTLSFKRGSYVVEQRLDLRNDGTAPLQAGVYFQFLRDGNPPEGESANNMFTGVVTFTGPAVYTEAKKFQKVEFSQVDKGKQDHLKQANDGWIAMVQHYFVAAFLPPANLAREYFTQKWSNNLYSAGLKTALPAVAPGQSGGLTVPLYVGPQEQEHLKTLAPGLDLVVDYGWLTVIAYPMFFVLSWINKLFANWGWTIISFTILLKLVFFPLNQKAGREMARMKLLAPKIEALKARFGDDRAKLNQGMMELYKAEKVNPLGGCLPILIQMPFLIAMYWVLVGAVELRNAPWIGWITDLSTPDPFYVLPVIMGASMIIQTKLNPPPPDPVQAKVMMILPVVFSVMFFFFPAGLVLYWTMQNILGIAQQWHLNRTTGQLSGAKPGTGKS